MTAFIPTLRVRRFSVPVATLIAALALTAPMSAAGDDERLVTLTLGFANHPSESSIEAPGCGTECIAQGWKRFEDYLNDSLRKNHETGHANGIPELRVVVHHGGIDDNFFHPLMRDKPRATAATGGPPLLDGAFLAPFRYVVAAHKHPDLILLAKAIRPSAVRMDSAPSDSELKWDREPKGYVAMSTYRSMLLLRTGQHGAVGPDVRWPPDRSSRAALQFGFTSPYSTSEFIYPLAHLRRLGLIRVLDVLATEPGPIELFRAFNGRGDGSGAPGPLRLLDLLKGVTPDKTYGHKETVGRWRGGSRQDPAHGQDSEARLPNLVGMNDLDLGHVWPDVESRNSEFTTVWSSEPIPMDVLVLRRDAAALTGLEDHVVAALVTRLRAALLTTRDLTPSQRALLFQWHQIMDADGTRGTGSWIRQPMLHGWTETSDAEFDGVRREVAVALGGEVVRVGLWAGSHPDWEQDRAGYFGELGRQLLAGESSKAPLALHYRLYEKDALLRMRGDLVEGFLHSAELPAFHAAELMVDHDAIVVARALYAHGTAEPAGKQSTVGVTEDQHLAVILSVRDVIKADGKPDFSIGRMAHGGLDSTSGYHIPLAYLRQRCNCDPAQDRLVACRDADEVLAVLRPTPRLDRASEQAPRHGFMASFEWERLKHMYPGIERELHATWTSDAIPNATLLVGPSGCGSAGRAEALASRLRAAVEDQPAQAATTGSLFRGYRVAGSPDAALERVYTICHSPAASNKVWAIVLGLVGLFTMALLVVAARRPPILGGGQDVLRSAAEMVAWIERAGAAAATQLGLAPAALQSRVRRLQTAMAEYRTATSPRSNASSVEQAKALGTVATRLTAISNTGLPPAPPASPVLVTAMMPSKHAPAGGWAAVANSLGNVLNFFVRLWDALSRLFGKGG